MTDGMTFTALIPARAGSKRLKNKNVRHLGRKPLLSWTIAAARAAPSLDDILVSTDCRAAATLAEGAGVRVVPRDASLAGDTARNIDVARALVASGELATDAVVVLQPTSPFRPTWHIEQCLAACNRENGALSVVALGSGKSVWLSDGTKLRRLLEAGVPDVSLLRPSGACYAFSTGALEQRTELFAPTDKTLPLDWPYSIDIDTAEDLARAEALLARCPYLEAELTHLSPPDGWPALSRGPLDG
jgi:CMP-N-acetylneuraminic acid synthetase